MRDDLNVPGSLRRFGRWLNGLVTSPARPAELPYRGARVEPNTGAALVPDSDHATETPQRDSTDDLAHLRSALLIRKATGAIHAPLRDTLTQTFGGQIAARPGVPGDKAPVTFLTIVPIEARCRAVRVAYGNCFDFPVTIQSASIYPSDTYSAAPQTDTNGGVAVPVIPTLRGAFNPHGTKLYFDNGGADRPTINEQGSQRSLLLPESADNAGGAYRPHAYQWSDWVKCESVTRADGAGQPLLFIYTTISSPDCTIVPADFPALNTDGYARGRFHYGLFPAITGTDHADDPTGTQYFVPNGGQMNPVLAVSYMTDEHGIQVISVGDGLARSPTNDTFSTAVWQACAELSMPELPVAFVTMAIGGGNPAIYNSLVRLNAAALRPSIAAIQVITGNGYAGHQPMRQLLGEMLGLMADLDEQHGSRLMINAPGCQPSWDGNKEWTDAFVSMRETLLSTSANVGIPVIDAPSVIAPTDKPWLYLDGFTDDDTNPNSRGTERVVGLARSAIVALLTSSPAVAFQDASRSFEAAGDAALALVVAERTKADQEFLRLQNDARSAEARGDWASAEEQWRALLTSNETAGWIHAAIIRALCRQGRTDDAEEALRRARMVIPNDRFIAMEAARIAEACQDWTQAGQRWSSVCEQFPLAWEGYAGGALVLREAGRLDEAEALLHAGVQIIPESIRLHHDLGRMAERRGDWPTAEKCWQDVLKIEDGLWWAHVSLSHALREQARPDEAEAAVQYAQTRIPDDRPLSIERARVAEAHKDWEETANRWSFVRERFPLAWEGYDGGARACRESGQFEEAEALLQAGVRMVPNELRLHLELGRLFERRGDWPGAETCWRAIIEINDGVGWAYVSLSRALREQSRLEDAEVAIQDAHTRLPDDHGIAVTHARNAEARKDWEEAERRWSAVRGRFPHTWEGYVGGAIALKELGLVPEAVTLLRDGIALLPDEAHLRRHLNSLTG